MIRASELCQAVEATPGAATGRWVGGAARAGALGAIVLLALALRTHRIAGQSLWYDEGVSAAMAPRELLEITVRAAADIHPPLYYYLLHYWATLAGTTEFALRWLSLIWGVLTVAAVCALGSRLFNRPVGMLAGLFAAVSPFLVYYSQEARMYAQVALFATLSFLLFGHLIAHVAAPVAAGGRRGQCVVVAAYLLCTAAMLYSHYFSFTIVLAQNLAALILVVVKWRQPARRSEGAPAGGALRPGGDGEIARWLGGWIILQVVVVASYVPWLLVSFHQLQSWPTISESFGLATLLRRVFLVFSYGLASDAVSWPNAQLVFYALLVSACMLPLARYRTRLQGALLVGLCLVTPVLVLYLLSLNRPMYNAKFLIVAAPAYAVLLAVGLENLRQLGNRALGKLRGAGALWSGGVVLSAIVLVGYPSGQSLAAYYADSRYARDDYRGLVASLSARASAEDAVVLDAPGQQEIFGYYYKGQASVFPLPGERPIDEAKTAAALATIVAEHPRVWLVLWATAESDPQSFVERWLDANAFKSGSQWFGTVRLCTYTSAAVLADNTQDVAVNFANLLRLKTVQFDSRVLEPGDTLNLTLGWEAQRPIDARYTVFVHILDGKELIWGQMDGEPAGGSKPTNAWPPGVTVADRRGVPVLIGTPPGQYMVELGLYQPESGQRLEIVGADGKLQGDRYLFGPIKIASPKASPPPEAAGIPHWAPVVFGNDVRLLGFKLNPLGRDVEGPLFKSGDTGHLTLFWRSGPPTGADIAVRLEVYDEGNRVLLVEQRPISEGLYPTGMWREGDLVRDQYKLPLAGLPPGAYTLLLKVLDQSGRTIDIKAGGTIAGNGALRLSRFEVR